MTNQGWTARALVAMVIAAAGAQGVTSCDLSDNPSPGEPSSDAGLTGADLIARPCKVTTDCSSNTICYYSSGSDSNGMCTVPNGMCTGPDDAVELTGSCYFGSHCQLSGNGSGECTFTPASQQAFTTATTAITLQSPTSTTPLSATDGFTLQWEPPMGQPLGSTTVAVIMNAVPVLSGSTNQISNPTNILWIWSSASPGGAVQQGSVPVQYGAQGLGPTGDLAPTRWGTNSLPNGVYWWFVYEIADGQVVASSLVQRFRVGPDEDPAQTCTTPNDCEAVGYAPETAACINGTCMQRCASNLDCPAVGSHCDFSTIINGGAGYSDIHSGFCDNSTQVDDAGTEDAAADAAEDTLPPDA